MSEPGYDGWVWSAAVAKCGSCGARIQFGMNPKTREWVPFNVDPTDQYPVGKVAHFATCPDAAKYRKRGKK